MERIKQLKQQYEQMTRLRDDNSLLTGFTLNTLAGNIQIASKRKALLILDYYIKELQNEIKYEEG